MLVQDHRSNDPGQREFLVEDPTNGKKVYVFLRVLTDEKQREIESRYPCKKKWFDTPRGKQMQKIYSEKDQAAILTDKMCYVWAGCEDFYIAAGDEEAAAFYSQAIGNGQIQVGEEFAIDGKLTDDIKKRVLEIHPALVVFLAEWLKETTGKYKKEEEDLGENL